jgi:two-component system, OmpR family, response regulator
MAARWPARGMLRASQMRILVVEDDDAVQSAVSRALRADGHAVTAASDLATAREGVAGGTDLIVLDLRLPDGLGLTLCRECRDGACAAPILIITALSQVAQRVQALDAGADDFLAKPFDVAELRARVRALGRRGPTPRGLVVCFGDVVLDFAGRSARRGGKPAPLTAREWAILEVLARRSGRLVPHVDLLESVWGESSAAAADTLAVLIGRLRRKLGTSAIRTFRGEGYAFAEGSKRAP